MVSDSIQVCDVDIRRELFGACATCSHLLLLLDGKSQRQVDWRYCFPPSRSPECHLVDCSCVCAKIYDAVRCGRCCVHSGSIIPAGGTSMIIGLNERLQRLIAASQASVRARYVMPLVIVFARSVLSDSSSVCRCRNVSLYVGWAMMGWFAELEGEVAAGVDSRRTHVRRVGWWLHPGFPWHFPANVVFQNRVRDCCEDAGGGGGGGGSGYVCVCVCDKANGLNVNVVFPLCTRYQEYGAALLDRKCP
jgi:hypothetical protein